MMNSSWRLLTLFLIPLVRGGRRDIIDMRSNSWISQEDFETAIKLSFPYSTCCNIYLSDSIDEVQVLFNQFIDIYPYEYLLKRRIYECDGYFLLGPTEDEIVKAIRKVPSSISTTEILIILNNQVQENSTIFDVSLYGNANANVVSMSGVWSLSENYLEPRIFTKVQKYNKMIHRTEMINLKGRELQASTFYRPPVAYLHTTINKTIDGVAEEVFTVPSDSERDGVEMKIFMLIAEKLNFTWTIRQPGEIKYGKPFNGTAWDGGIIGLLQQKKIDIAFATIWMTVDHNNFVNLTEPWYQLFIHFLVPRPQPTSSFWALTRPFSVGAWTLLIATILLQSLYIYGRAWIDPNFPRRFRNFVLVTTEMIGRLLGTWVPRNVGNVRLELHLWQTAGVILVTAYSSSLAAWLASSQYEDRIDTIRQFIEANLSWGRKAGTPYFEDYFDLEDPYSSRLPDRYVYVRSDEETHKNIISGNYAIIGRFIESVFFPEDEISNEDLQNYRLMREKVGKFWVSFAVQPWLLQPVNTVMLWLKESGITFFHLRDVIRRRASYNLRQVLIENDGNDGRARVLKLTPLGAGFLALLVGLLISTFVFYLELRHVSGTRSIRQVLRDIERKRRESKSRKIVGGTGRNRKCLLKARPRK